MENSRIEAMIAHTNKRIVTWYENVKLDYGVIGEGVASYKEEESKVIVEYIEDGEAKNWEMYFVPEYLENGIDWVFDCWGALV